jgi:hypothetical protein
MSKQVGAKTMSPAQVAELQRIQASIPRSWMGNLAVETQGYAVIREVAERAVADPEVSEEVRLKAQTLLDSGFLDKTTQEVEPIAAELVDAYTAKEILKSVIAKRLPKPPHAPTFREAMARFTTAKAAYDARYKEEA